MKILVLALLAGCGNISPFYCSVDSDCEMDNGATGTCEIGPKDYEVCAYPDTTCTSSKLRYDQSAGNLADLCVGDEGNLEP